MCIFIVLDELEALKENGQFIGRAAGAYARRNRGGTRGLGDTGGTWYSEVVYGSSGGQ